MPGIVTRHFLLLFIVFGAVGNLGFFYGINGSAGIDVKYLHGFIPRLVTHREILKIGIVFSDYQSLWIQNSFFKDDVTCIRLLIDRNDEPDAVFFMASNNSELLFTFSPNYFILLSHSLLRLNCFSTGSVLSCLKWNMYSQLVFLWHTGQSSTYRFVNINRSLSSHSYLCTVAPQYWQRSLYFFI